MSAGLHQNSVQAYWEGRLDLFGKRHQQIVLALRRRVPLSDREVMTACGFTDPNAVRPRITELLSAGIVEEAGNQTCPVTGKTVRLVRLVRREAQAEFSLGDVLTPAVVENLGRKTA